jgi:hypothetical protein
MLFNQESFVLSNCFFYKGPVSSMNEGVFYLVFVSVTPHTSGWQLSYSLYYQPRIWTLSNTVKPTPAER